MCRFAAYFGPEIRFEDVVVAPAHSLLEQSQHATEAKLAVNGDGFGIAWYDSDGEAGLYRDVLPAWSDGNLLDLCRLVRSGLFLAHVRASTEGETSRVNCHPFRFENWTFMHNGQIGDFAKIKRALEALLSDELYNARRGTTDSELLFLLMLQNGLREDPRGAAARAIEQIVSLQDHGAKPNRLTLAFSDGTSLYGFRQSSDGKSPTLYVGQDAKSGGTVLASEPLDANPAGWRRVEEGELVKICASSQSVAKQRVI